MVEGDDLESGDLSPSENEEVEEGIKECCRSWVDVSDTTEREMGGGEPDISFRRCLVRLGEELGKVTSIVELPLAVLVELDMTDDKVSDDPALLLPLLLLELDWTTAGGNRVTGTAQICLLAAVLAFVSRINSTSSGVILANCAKSVHPAVGFL